MNTVPSWNRFSHAMIYHIEFKLNTIFITVTFRLRYDLPTRYYETLEMYHKSYYDTTERLARFYDIAVSNYSVRGFFFILLLYVYLIKSNRVNNFIGRYTHSPYYILYDSTTVYDTISTLKC